MAEDSGARARIAFIMSGKYGAPGTGGHTGGGGDGVFSVLDPSQIQLEIGKSGPFSHIVSNMMQALGYFESSLGLQTAFGKGMGLDSGLGFLDGKAGYSLFSGRGK